MAKKQTSSANISILSAIKAAKVGKDLGVCKIRRNILWYKSCFFFKKKTIYSISQVEISKMLRKHTTA